jgi:hypothetical protein
VSRGGCRRRRCGRRARNIGIPGFWDVSGGLLWAVIAWAGNCRGQQLQLGEAGAWRLGPTSRYFVIRDGAAELSYIRQKAMSERFAGSGALITEAASNIAAVCAMRRAPSQDAWCRRCRCGCGCGCGCWSCQLPTRAAAQACRGARERRAGAGEKGLSNWGN